MKPYIIHVSPGNMGVEGKNRANRTKAKERRRWCCLLHSLGALNQNPTHRDRRWMGSPSGVPGDLPVSALWGLLFLLSLVPLPSACCPGGETAQRPGSLSICSLALWFLDWCALCDQQAPRTGEFDWSVCYTKAGNVDGERISLMHMKLSVRLLGNGSWFEKAGCLLWRPPLKGSRKTQQSLSIFTRGGKGIWLPS